MDLINRGTRREIILDNCNKAIKIKEKQRAILEKTKEFEKIQEDEKLKKLGCPIQKAEKRSYESIAQTMKEREARNAEFMKLL